MAMCQSNMGPPVSFSDEIVSTLSQVSLDGSIVHVFKPRFLEAEHVSDPSNVTLFTYGSEEYKEEMRRVLEKAEKKKNELKEKKKLRKKIIDRHRPLRVKCDPVLVRKKTGTVSQTQEKIRIPCDVFDLVFHADEMLRENKISVEEFAEGLWQLFPLYNFRDEKLYDIIEYLCRSIVSRKKVVVPYGLLSIAVLNIVDMHVRKSTSSCFFKTSILKNIPAGHRSAGTRFLKEKKYIEEHGNVWKRSKKRFFEPDFWLENAKLNGNGKHFGG